MLESAPVHEPAPGWIKTTLNSMTEFFMDKPKEWKKAPWASPHAMPEVPNDRIIDGVKEWQSIQRRKRKTPGSESHQPPPGLETRGILDGASPKRSKIGGGGKAVSTSGGEVE